LSLVNQIYHGLQKTSVVVFGQFISNALALLFVFLIYHLTNPSILLIAFGYGSSLIISNLILTFSMYRSSRQLVPTLDGFDKSKINYLMSLGLRFFIIQVSVLLIFMTDKILIVQLLGPEHVMPYEILYKLFSVFTIIQGLILAPLWPAYSDAYQRGESEWIKNSVKQQIKFSCVLFIGALFLALIGPFIVKIWIGDKVTVDGELFFLFSIFIIVSVWNNVFGVVLGAIGKVRLGAIHTSFSAVINVPLSIILVKYFELGVAGIILSTIVSISLSAFISPIQVWYFVVSKRKIDWAEKVLS
jgi:O-antigen/teichoic acid export membrane protein